MPQSLRTGTVPQGGSILPAGRESALGPVEVVAQPQAKTGTKRYTVQAPDGHMITLEGPEGASQEEVIAQAQRLYTPESSGNDLPTFEQMRQQAGMPPIGAITALDASGNIPSHRPMNQFDRFASNISGGGIEGIEKLISQFPQYIQSGNPEDLPIIGPSIQKIREFGQGDFSNPAMAIPVIGPMAVSAAHALLTGDYGGGLGTIGAMLTPALSRAPEIPELQPSGWGSEVRALNLAPGDVPSGGKIVAAAKAAAPDVASGAAKMAALPLAGYASRSLPPMVQGIIDASAIPYLKAGTKQFVRGVKQGIEAYRGPVQGSELMPRGYKMPPGVTNEWTPPITKAFNDENPRPAPLWSGPTEIQPSTPEPDLGPIPTPSGILPSGRKVGPALPPPPKPELPLRSPLWNGITEIPPPAPAAPVAALPDRPLFSPDIEALKASRRTPPLTPAEDAASKFQAAKALSELPGGTAMPVTSPAQALPAEGLAALPAKNKMISEPSKFDLRDAMNDLLLRRTGTVPQGGSILPAEVVAQPRVTTSTGTGTAPQGNTNLFSPPASSAGTGTALRGNPTLFSQAVSSSAEARDAATLADAAAHNIGPHTARIGLNKVNVLEDYFRKNPNARMGNYSHADILKNPSLLYDLTTDEKRPFLDAAHAHGKANNMMVRGAAENKYADLVDNPDLRSEATGEQLPGSLTMLANRLKGLPDMSPIPKKITDSLEQKLIDSIDAVKKKKKKK